MVVVGVEERGGRLVGSAFRCFFFYKGRCRIMCLNNVRQFASHTTFRAINSIGLCRRLCVHHVQFGTWQRGTSKICVRINRPAACNVPVWRFQLVLFTTHAIRLLDTLISLATFPIKSNGRRQGQRRKGKTSRESEEAGMWYNQQVWSGL